MDGKPEYVTLAIVKELLEAQDRAYRTTLQLLMDDMKQEIRNLRKDVEDVKLSLQFSQGEIDAQKQQSEDTNAKYEHLEDRLKFVESNMEDCYNLEKQCDDLEDKNEYLENMSRRNNVKIIGLNEDTGNEKTWEDTEEFVITTIKKKLDIEGVKIERAHRVGKPRPSHRTNPDGSTTKVPPRPIIARLSSWKQKEAILKAAREVKPKEIRFYQDLSTRTLEKRAQKIPDLIAERKRGNTAYLVLDKLIIKRPKDK